MTPDALQGLLSPKQIRSVADAQARINLWHGAIRFGKTIASLLAWLIYVAQAPPGELVVVAKTSITAARNVFGPLQDPALFGKLAAQTSYTPGAPFAVILGRRVSVIGANDSTPGPSPGCVASPARGRTSTRRRWCRRTSGCSSSGA